MEQDKKNHEAYIKSGEIFEDRQNAYERMTRAVERLTTGVQSLADLLHLPMPDLPTSATLSKGGLQIVENTSSFTVRDEGSAGIWDDEEERRFYEELPDLKEMVPASLLGVKDKNKTKKEDGTDEEGKVLEEGQVDERQDEDRRKEVEEDIKRQLEQMNLNDEEKGEAETSVEETLPAGVKEGGELEGEGAFVELDNGVVPEEEGLQSGPAARLTALFAALPEAVNREMIDKLAVDFAFLNSKAARKRLVKVCPV